MKTIWKFEIPVQDEISEVLMPKGAKIVHVGSQPDRRNIALWAQVDSEAKKVIRRFKVYGTGHPLMAGTYVGTVLVGDMLVWHVFERW